MTGCQSLRPGCYINHVVVQHAAAVFSNLISKYSAMGYAILVYLPNAIKLPTIGLIPL